MVKVKPGFILLLSGGLYFGSFRLTLLFLLASLLHEMGHLVAAYLCALPVRNLTLSAQGAELKLINPPKSFGQEILLCLSGPAANLLCALLCLGLGVGPSFLGANLLLGLFNLLPVLPLDGGNGLFALLSLLTSWHRAEIVTRRLSKATAVFVGVSGFLLFCLEGGQPYLLLLGLWLVSCWRGK